MITSDQLKDVLERTDALARYLNIDQKKVEFEEEQLRTQAPDFWEDPKRAQEQMKKVKGIERWLKDYKAARSACMSSITRPATGTSPCSSLSSP